MPSLCHSEDLLEIRALKQFFKRVKETDIQIKTTNPKPEVNSQTEIRKLPETTTGKINSDYSIPLMETGFLNY